MSKTLLEKAKSCKIHKFNASKITDEHIELALAWLKSDVSTKQVSFAVHKNTSNNHSGNVLYSVAVALKVAYESGMLKINK